MFELFPKTADEPLKWAWSDWQPYSQWLLDTPITEAAIDTWIQRWSTLGTMFAEVNSRLNVAKDVDTTDTAAEAAYKRFMSEIYPEYQKANFLLQKKLVESGHEPDYLRIPMRNIKTSIEIFREENVPLFTQESDLETRYNKILGAQTVEWDGQETTLIQLATVLEETDRNRREQAWRLSEERRTQDRTAIDEIWREYMALRKQIAHNAGLKTYRAFAWKDRNRHDYTPEQALQFVDAIEQVVVPAMQRQSERRRLQLGYDRLMPWDIFVDPQGREPLRPYNNIETFIATSEAIFTQVDPELGRQFQTMREEKLLDLDNRKGKAPGGYCTGFPIAERSFIFMNAVGTADDVATLLHEAGHTFHGFARFAHLDVMMQRSTPMEFNEVASMAMELLAAPYLTQDSGGFFSEGDAARYRADHLKGIINFWPYMAVVVAFQHWIYDNHDLATDPAECDKKWLELWRRFMKNADYRGFDNFITNHWRRQLHIFVVPFYYVEYGLAQLGAVQVWANALKNQQAALQAYRKALALGGTVTLPELYTAAGAKLAFDAPTLQAAVNLIERTIGELEEPAH